MKNRLIVITTIFLLIAASFGFAKVYTGMQNGQVEASGTEQIDTNSSQDGLVDPKDNLPNTNTTINVDNHEDVENNEFSLEISSIKVKQKVYPNVDPSNSKEYLNVLEKGIAHGKYTKLPNQAIDSGNVYLFAHNEGYANGKNIGFFHNLTKLKKGDEAIIRFKGNVYVYRFRSSKIVDPQDVSVYTGESANPTLTLQTCHNGQKERLIATFDLVAWY